MARRKTQEVQEVNKGQEAQGVLLDYYGASITEEMTNAISEFTNSPTLKPIFDHIEEFAEEIDVLDEYAQEGKLPDFAAHNVWDFLECVKDTAKDENILSTDLLREVLGCELSADGYPVNRKYRQLVKRAENWQSELPDGYRKLYQDASINMLATLKRDQFRRINNISNECIFATKDKKISFKFDDYNTLVLDLDVIIVIDSLLNKIAEQIPHKEQDANVLDRTRHVDYSIGEYLEKRNLKDAKEARKKLNKAACSLYALSILIKQENGNERHARLLDAITIPDSGNYVKNGKISVSFTMEYARYIANYGSVLILPDAIAQLNAKTYPHAYRLGRKFYLNYKQNYGRENERRLKFKTLLAVCPDFPTLEEIAKTRQYYQRIIEPFERNMDALVLNGAIADWRYCDTNGVDIDNYHRANDSFSEMLNWCVEFTPAVDYPTDMLNRIAEKKKESRKKAIKRREQVAIKLAVEKAKKKNKAAVD